jgi:phosphoketolase
MTNNIATDANLTAASTQIDDLLSHQQCEEVYDEARHLAIDAREMAEYEARMREADEDWSPSDDCDDSSYPVEDFSNEYMEGDQGEW